MYQNILKILILLIIPGGIPILIIMIGNRLLKLYRRFRIKYTRGSTK